MNGPPDPVYDRLRRAEPDVLGTDELSVLLGDIATLRSWCDALQVRATRRQRELADDGRAADPRHALSRHGRTSSKDAKAASDREAVCTSMPGFEEALAGGSVSSGHVDAVANAARSLDEPARAELAAHAADLLRDAERLGVDAFARSARALARAIATRQSANAETDELEAQRRCSKITRWVDPVTGMCHTNMVLDPISDREFWAGVQRARAQLRRRPQHRTATWDRLTVDAVVSVATRPTAGPGALTARLGVLVDLATLTSGLHATSICETDNGHPLPVSTIRRLACEADIIPMVLDGAGVVLDEGRAKRLATPEQRVALEAMHRTCVHPDCTVTFDECRIHHTDPWGADGLTDLADLAPVCEPHHHLVHEGGWGLAMTPDRIATWTMPDGTVYWSGPTNDRQPARVA